MNLDQSIIDREVKNYTEQLKRCEWGSIAKVSFAVVEIDGDNFHSRTYATSYDAAAKAEYLWNNLTADEKMRQTVEAVVTITDGGGYVGAEYADGGVFDDYTAFYQPAQEAHEDLVELKQIGATHTGCIILWRVLPSEYYAINPNEKWNGEYFTGWACDIEGTATPDEEEVEVYPVYKNDPYGNSEVIGYTLNFPPVYPEIG